MSSRRFTDEPFKGKLEQLPYDCPAGFPAFLRRHKIQNQKRKGDFIERSSLWVEPWVAALGHHLGRGNDALVRRAIELAVADAKWKAALETVLALAPAPMQGSLTADAGSPFNVHVSSGAVEAFIKAKEAPCEAKSS